MKNFSFLNTLRTFLSIAKVVNIPIVSVRKNIHQNWKGMLHRIIVDDGQVDSW